MVLTATLVFSIIVSGVALTQVPKEHRLAVIPEGVRLAHRPCFSADGQTVAWSGLVDGRMWLYVGGERRSGPYDCV
jgi:hypothetical protein